MSPTRTDRPMYFIGLIAAATWSIGTNLLEDPWYVAHGISVGDVIFAGWILYGLTQPHVRLMLIDAFRTLVEHTVLLTSFVVILLTSMAVNSFRYGASWSDVFPILRLMFFSVIVAFTAAYCRRFGMYGILMAFLAGIALLLVDQLNYVYTYNLRYVVAFPILRDTNVVGNMLGIGAFLASVGIFAGRLVVPLAFAVLFAAATVTTYSKGAWLMAAIALAANAIAILMHRPLSARDLRRIAPAAVVFMAVIAAVVYVYGEQVIELLVFKLQSTEDAATAVHRYRFMIAGLYAMFDHPLFGVGFRNYDVTYNLYREIMPEPSDNAHNVFVQIGAVGGIPALVVFLILFAYPFVDLWRALRPRRMPLRAAAYVAAAVLVFGISGSVQLQLMAQPFFWFFTGLTKAWRWKETSISATV